MNDDNDLFGSEFTNFGSGERAINDISLTIGFSMLIFVFILVPYLTVLNRLAVRVPETNESTVSLAVKDEEQCLIPVFILKNEGGYRVLLDEEKKRSIELHSLGNEIEKVFGRDLAGAGSVVFHIKADKELSYQHVMEVLSKLRDFEENVKKPAEFQLFYTHEGR